MALEKTTILSVTDAAEAQQQYQGELGNIVLFVALGDGPDVETMVRKADVIAGTGSDLRRVVWAKNPEYIAELIAEHPRTEGVEAVDSETPDRAYTLSFSGTICDVISHAEEEPDNLRIFTSYAKAEADHEEV